MLGESGSVRKHFKSNALQILKLWGNHQYVARQRMRIISAVVKHQQSMWDVFYPCAIFNAVDVELHGDVKAVKEIATEHQGVFWGVHSMDPA